MKNLKGSSIFSSLNIDLNEFVSISYLFTSKLMSFDLSSIENSTNTSIVSFNFVSRYNSVVFPAGTFTKNEGVKLSLIVILLKFFKYKGT